MTAVASDLNFFASRVSAGLPTVFVAIGDFTPAWYVRTFLVFMVGHYSASFH
jgi:hypothetical protein